VLADDLREPGRTRDTRHGSDDVRWAWKFSMAGRRCGSCERHADELVGADAYWK
jgi:hypothetical protein